MRRLLPFVAIAFASLAAPRLLAEAPSASSIRVGPTRPIAPLGPSTPGPQTPVQPLPPTISDVSPKEGPLAGGTSITITGTNFVAGSTVSMAMQPLGEVVVASATRITGTTPPSASGTRNIAVTTKGGTATCYNCFRYGPVLPPGESIDETWERSGEGPRGLWTGEAFQRGTGTSVGMTVHCPTGTRAIGGGIENNAMTPFAIWQSHPLGNVPGWYFLMHRNLVPPVGGGNPYPPTPYAFFVTVTCIDTTVWASAMK